MKQLKHLDYEIAVQTGLQNVKVKNTFEKIPLESSLGRILANDILCIKNIPSFDNSAMDGFAFDINSQSKKLKVLGTIFAGDTTIYNLGLNESYKIMTGAMIPKGANSIIPVENTIKFDEEYVEIPNNVKQGDNCKYKGEDYKLKDIVFTKGQIVDAKMISILAAQGISMIEVYVKLKIAVLSTGNELKEPWESSSEFEIYNSNSSGIIAILKEHNFDASYLGVVPDNLEDTVKFFNNLKEYDLVISTGGISMGDADFVAQAYEKNNLNVLFHGVNVKPGRPTMMGIMDKTFVMAMPGNPLTALVNTYLLALPIIYKLSASIEYNYNFVYAKNNTQFKVNKSRANIVLGDMHAGVFNVIDDNKYSSGAFSPILRANSVMISLSGKSEVKKDEMIKVVLLNSKLLKDKIDIYNKG